MGNIRELVILNEIAQALNRSVALETALQVTLAQVADHFGLQTGWIWLRNETSGEFYLAAAQNLPSGLANNPARMEGWCYCLESFAEGDLARAANVDVITCSRLKKLVTGTDGLRYHASVPLFAHGKEIGLLNVASTDWRELSADELRLLYTVGDLLGIAVERARLYARSMSLGVLEERNRLAREIHDTLAQGLTAIALQLETADALLDGADQQARIRHALQQALTLTRTNLEEARRSVLDLRAAPLEGKSLAAALAALVAETNTRHPALTLQLSVIGGQRPLPMQLEVGLYRIAQEAVTNMLSHAAATHGKLSLVITPAQVSLAIADDGCGFDPEEVNPQRYGLTGMNERVKLLGGALVIESAVGMGSIIRVKVPLGEEHRHATAPINQA